MNTDVESDNTFRISQNKFHANLNKVRREIVFKTLNFFYLSAVETKPFGPQIQANLEES